MRSLRVFLSFYMLVSALKTTASRPCDASKLPILKPNLEMTDKNAVQTFKASKFPPKNHNDGELAFPGLAARSPIRDNRKSEDLAHATKQLTQEQKRVVLVGVGQAFQAEQLAARRNAQMAGQKFNEVKRSREDALEELWDSFEVEDRLNRHHETFVENYKATRAAQKEITREINKAGRAKVRYSKEKMRANRDMRRAGQNLEHISMMNKDMRKTTLKVAPPLRNLKQYLRPPTKSWKQVKLVPHAK